MHDILIIGAGHNGLTCAGYLARKGYKVKVVERRGVVGGAAVTEEFHPGFRNSVAAYTVSLLQPKIIRDLRLHQHGLRIVERRAQIVGERAHATARVVMHAVRIGPAPLCSQKSRLARYHAPSLTTRESERSVSAPVAIPP